MGGGGGGRLLIFSAFRMGAYSNKYGMLTELRNNKQLLDEVLVISGIIKVEASVISRTES